MENTDKDWEDYEQDTPEEDTNTCMYCGEECESDFCDKECADYYRRVGCI